MRSKIAIVLVAGVACTNVVPEPSEGASFGTPGPDDTEIEPKPEPGSTSEDDRSTSTGNTGDSSSTEAEPDSSDDEGGLKLDVSPEDSGNIDPEIAEVFGHSGNMLYRMDPDTKEVEPVGPFTGCAASIIDIALDADSNMYGTAFRSLWSIDRFTGDCTLIAEGEYPTSLSFVPAGTIDADEEALVGFVGDRYIRIDVQTGEITDLATLSDGLSSSGDMVSVIDGSSWLTVVGPGCNNGDCIVELNPSNGLILNNYGPLPYSQVYGLAFWGGRAYGFAREGVLFEIDFSGDMMSTTAIPIPDAPANLEFFGAGSTTSAPPVAE